MHKKKKNYLSPKALSGSPVAWTVPSH